MADLKALKRGVVRIAAPQLMSCSVLPEVIAGFKRECPDIQVRLFDCMVESVLPRGAQRRGGLWAWGPSASPCPTLRPRTLFELPFVVVFPPGHALAAKKTVRWSEALAHPLIALQGEFTQRLRVTCMKPCATAALTPSNEVGFMTTAFSMVSAGLGVTTCLPYAGTLIKRFQLESRPLVDPEIQRKFFIFTRKDRPLSPAAQRFAEFLTDYVAAERLAGGVSSGFHNDSELIGVAMTRRENAALTARRFVTNYWTLEITISMRRLRWRPSAVSLLATGLDSP